MKKAIKIVIDTIIYVVIAILLGYIVLRAANKIGIYKVLTGSMEDGIHPGDYIIVKHTKDLDLDDIVTYKRGNYYITHRIIEIDKEKGKLIAKGDANNIEDDPAVDMSEVVGKCLYKSALIKFIVTYKYVLICLFVMLFGTSTILGILNKKEQEEKEQDENNKEEIDNNSIEEEKIENNESIDEIEDKKETTEENEEKTEIKEEKNEDVKETEELSETENIEVIETTEEINKEIEENIEENEIINEVQEEKNDDLEQIKQEIDDIYNMNSESKEIKEKIGDGINEEKGDNTNSVHS